MAPGSPFGPGIRTLLAYLHHSLLRDNLGESLRQSG
jgi:hypothetical protein